MKKKIIFVIHFKLTKTHYEKFDITELEERHDFEIEIHEIGKFINPNLENILKRNFSYINTKSFDSFRDWKVYLLNMINLSDKNLFVINFVDWVNFNSFRVNYFLKKNKSIKVIEFSRYVHPFLESSPIEFSRLLYLIKTAILNFKKIKIYFSSKFLQLFKNYFKIFPDYLITTGNKKEFLNQKKNGVKLINGNSYDYNLYLKNNFNLNLNKANVGIYLDSPTPIYDNDNILMASNKKNFGTPEKWYSSLNLFFNFLENLKNIQIMIAPHPKVKYEKKNLKYYFNRKFCCQPLVEAAKTSKLLIGRNSAGFSYAAIYKIPAIFVYSNELKQSKSSILHEQRYFANETGLSPINIDEPLNENKINQLLSFDKKTYNQYLEKYLTSRKDKKTNHEIIADL